MDLHLSLTPYPALLGRALGQHRQTNRLYRRMRVGAAQRQLSLNNGQRVLAPD